MSAKIRVNIEYNGSCRDINFGGMLDIGISLLNNCRNCRERRLGGGLGRLLGGSWEAPGMLLGGSWETPGRLMGGCWEAPGKLLGIEIHENGKKNMDF